MVMHDCALTLTLTSLIGLGLKLGLGLMEFSSFMPAAALRMCMHTTSHIDQSDISVSINLVSVRAQLGGGPMFTQTGP